AQCPGLTARSPALIAPPHQNELDGDSRDWQDFASMNVPRLLTAGVFLSISVLHAQQQDAAPPNLENLAKEIDGIEQKQKQGKLSEKAALLAQVQAATVSGTAAANFYTQAVEEVQFKGKKDKVEAFTEWKKSHGDMLRSKEMQTALQLHLRYLLLSLQRKDLEKPETQLPALTAYLNELIASDDLFAGQKPIPDEQKSLLEKPLGQSVFAQWMRMGEWLPDEKSWESKPGDVTGILEKNVRSVLREKKDPQLIQTWDLQMKVEAGRITVGRSEHQAEQFNTVTMPKMLFKRAQDMILVGQPNRGLTEMVTLVRTYPLHPDFASWLGKIRESIKPAAQTSPQ
ncbi:MAG: hypothetical protein ACOYM3_06395, partial [Terrimicrobiaceae bacterium]